MSFPFVNKNICGYRIYRSLIASAEYCKTFNYLRYTGRKKKEQTTDCGYPYNASTIYLNLSITYVIHYVLLLFLFFLLLSGALSFFTSATIDF